MSPKDNTGSTDNGSKATSNFQTGRRMHMDFDDDVSIKMGPSDPVDSATFLARVDQRLQELDRRVGDALRRFSGSEMPEERYERLQQARQTIYGGLVGQGAVIDAQNLKQRFAADKLDELYRHLWPQLIRRLSEIDELRNQVPRDEEHQSRLEQLVTRETERAIDNHERLFELGCKMIEREVARSLHPSDIQQEPRRDSRTIFEKLFGTRDREKGNHNGR